MSSGNFPLERPAPRKATKFSGPFSILPGTGTPTGGDFPVAGAGRVTCDNKPLLHADQGNRVQSGPLPCPDVGYGSKELSGDQSTSRSTIRSTSRLRSRNLPDSEVRGTKGTDSESRTGLSARRVMPLPSPHSAEGASKRLIPSAILSAPIKDPKRGREPSFSGPEFLFQTQGFEAKHAQSIAWSVDQSTQTIQISRGHAEIGVALGDSFGGRRLSPDRPVFGQR